LLEPAVSLLIIQIPCFNEEKTLPVTIADLPRELTGVDRVEYLIIDDGSSDRTVDVARELGVHHLVKFPANRGLASAFRAGIDACLRLGADFIVNTDGDNQYSGKDIPALVEPVVAGRADISIGDRQTDSIEHFSPMKKRLQKLGSWVVRQFSATDVVDTTSGFRCWSREAATQLNLINPFTYTLESIIQTGHAGLKTESVAIGTNAKLRESRLFKSIRQYVTRSAGVILRSYLLYKPFSTFLGLGSVFFSGGVLIGLRFLWIKFVLGGGGGNVQSLLLAAILLIIGVQLGMMAMVADLIAANRKLQEESLVRLRRLERAVAAAPGDEPAVALQGQVAQEPPAAAPPTDEDPRTPA
jgi:glycosyltransferase involved in cell wall biosynthesis